MMRNLFVAAVFFIPSFLNGSLQDIRKELLLQVYHELISVHEFDSRDYWISTGKVQALSEAIYLIDRDLMGLSY
jgi:hypothetical protein